MIYFQHISLCLLRSVVDIVGGGGEKVISLLTSLNVRRGSITLLWW